MKALSLTQPWATLIACGSKRIETRSWSTSYRGPIAIHAAKGLGAVGGKRGLLEQCAMRPFDSVLREYAPNCQSTLMMPLGAIIATANLVKVKMIDMELRAQVLAQTLTPHEFVFGNYDSGRFAWFLEDVKPVTSPIYCKGALGLWTCEELITV